MSLCTICNNSFEEMPFHSLHGKPVCEECYLDEIWPKVRPMHRESSAAEFMIRLKSSYPAKRQQFD